MLKASGDGNERKKLLGRRLIDTSIASFAVVAG